MLKVGRTVRATVWGYLTILRPPNLVMSFVGVLLGSAVALGSVSALLGPASLAITPPARPWRDRNR